MKKRSLILGFCLALFGAVVCRAADQIEPMPGYRITALERADMGATRRALVRVTVGPGLSRADVTRVIAAVAERHDTEHALVVAVSEHGTGAGMGYTVARATWAPGGDWARASDASADPQRKSYRWDIDYRSKYFERKSALSWPAEYGLTWEQVAFLAAEMEAECLAATSAVFDKHPTGNSAAEERARTAAIERVARRRGLTAREAITVWDLYLSETLDMAD